LNLSHFSVLETLLVMVAIRLVRLTDYKRKIK